MSDWLVFLGIPLAALLVGAIVTWLGADRLARGQPRRLDVIAVGLAAAASLLLLFGPFFPQVRWLSVSGDNPQVRLDHVPGITVLSLDDPIQRHNTSRLFMPAMVTLVPLAASLVLPWQHRRAIRALVGLIRVGSALYATPLTLWLILYEVGLWFIPSIAVMWLAALRTWWPGKPGGTPHPAGPSAS